MTMNPRPVTKTCGRCGGTGKHLYNQLHGDVCYGCQGKGVVLANPRAAGARITADLKWCEQGDVVQVAGAGTCRVVEVQQGEFRRKVRDVFGGFYIDLLPERLVLECMIDGKIYYSSRHTPEREHVQGARLTRVNKKTGVWHPIEALSVSTVRHVVQHTRCGHKRIVELTGTVEERHAEVQRLGNEKCPDCQAAE